MSAGFRGSRFSQREDSELETAIKAMQEGGGGGITTRGGHQLVVLAGEPGPLRRFTLGDTVVTIETMEGSGRT